MSKKNYKLYRAKVKCPCCHKNYSVNPNCECPHCHAKFYDLSFVDLPVENKLPVYVRYKYNGYTGFKDNPKEEYDVFITLATMGINVENNLDYSYETSPEHQVCYWRSLKPATFNVKTEMEALPIHDENGNPVLFMVEAEPKKKK